MFETISSAPEDAILGLTEQFYNDSRSNKINLGIGVYTDENGSTPILNSVKKAEKILINKEQTKNYLSIEGIAEFAHCTQNLLFGESSNIIHNNLARTAQTPGGTGALRIAADFLANQKNNTKRVWISNPSWPNHRNIFLAAGLNVYEYPWYNSENHSLDFDNLLSSLQSQVKAGDIVLFHSCCHNPTGVDPTIEQWKKLATLSKFNHWLPLFDFAYQGFANDLEKDAQGLRLFSKYNQEMIVASSYSKNMGLYNERVGALTIIAQTTMIADKVFSHIKATIRTNYSNPPFHGAAIVTTILSHEELRVIWHYELTIMRRRIRQMRQLFVSTLLKKGLQKDLSFIKSQNGMFSYSDLTKKQVMLLREKFGIYVLDSGRLNIASMTCHNMDFLCNAIISISND
ncbi:MAG: amino acid aminotransferase [Candidatus Dasytiphilus stammeri]